MSDFLEEVDEQLRSDRYEQILTKGWPWAAGVAVGALALALAWWGVQTYQHRQSAKASEAFQAGIEAVQRNDSAGTYIAFGKAAEGAPRGFKALALMQQGAARLQDNKVDDAVKLFDQAAAAAPDKVIGDMARLKSAFALMDTAPYAAMEERLKPLTDAKRPYHAAASEALAMAKLKAGKVKEARGDFVVLNLRADVPKSTRERAQLAIAAIDSGAASGLADAVKASLQLPPPPPLPLGGLQNGPDAGAAQ